MLARQPTYRVSVMFLFSKSPCLIDRLASYMFSGYQRLFRQVKVSGARRWTHRHFCWG